MNLPRAPLPPLHDSRSTRRHHAPHPPGCREPKRNFPCTGPWPTGFRRSSGTEPLSLPCTCRPPPQPPPHRGAGAAMAAAVPCLILPPAVGHQPRPGARQGRLSQPATLSSARARHKALPLPGGQGAAPLQLPMWWASPGRGRISNSRTGRYPLLAMGSRAHDLASSCLRLPRCRWCRERPPSLGCFENQTSRCTEEVWNSARHTELPLQGVVLLYSRIGVGAQTPSVPRVT